MRYGPAKEATNAMLTGLRIKNFKAWKDTGDIRLAPLTVLFGANSSGKSSLGHLLLALKQTAASADLRPALHTGDDASLVDLGRFVECLHKHDANAELEFSLDWSSAEKIQLDQAAGSGLRLTTTVAADANGEPVVRRLRYELHNDKDVVLSATLTNDLELETQGVELVRAPDHDGAIEPAEKFYRVSEQSLARYRNAGFLSDFALCVERNLASLSHLGPMRERPLRSYKWTGHRPDDVGAKGERAIAAILAADSEGRKLSRGEGQKAEGFAGFIARWLVDLGVIKSFDVRAKGEKDFEVTVTTRSGLTEVALPDVGFGVSQILPALVQVFYCPQGSTVWMEQPEIHLHPHVQAQLADVFISAIRAHENGRPRNVQLIVETHSEYFLNRLQRRIAEEILKPDEVAIYFATADDKGSELEELTVNEYGDITNWPENFFGDEMADIMARTVAAAERRK